MYVCMYVYACMHVCMHVRMYVRMYVCMYVHTLCGCVMDARYVMYVSMPCYFKRSYVMVCQVVFCYVVLTVKLCWFGLCHVLVKYHNMT